MAESKSVSGDWTALAAQVNKLARERRRLRKRLEKLDAAYQKAWSLTFCPSRTLGVIIVLVVLDSDGSFQVDVSSDLQTYMLGEVIANSDGRNGAYLRAFHSGNSEKAMDFLEKLGKIPTERDLVFFDPLGEFLEKVNGKWKRVR